MARLIQKGDAYDYVNTTGSTIDAGTVKVVGGFVGVVQNDIPAGELGSLALTGVWEVAKENTTAAFTAGGAVYWNDTNGYADSPGTYMGLAWADADATDDYVRVKLDAEAPVESGGGEG